MKIYSAILTILIISNLILKGQDEHSGAAGHGGVCEETINKKAEKLFKEAERKFKYRAYSDATMYLKQAIEYEENYYEAYYLLGRINYERLNLIAAGKYFSKAHELCPTYKLKTYFYLGRIAYDSENYDEAGKYLSKYLKADAEKVESEPEYKPEDYHEALKMEKYARVYSDLLNNPVPFNPNVVEGISTKEDEYLAILTPDNEIAYFTRNAALPPQKTAWGTDKKFKEKFMYSLRTDNKFDSGDPMPSPFNLHDNEGGATVTVDNKTLYYTLCQCNKGCKYQNCDIYKSEYRNGSWSPIAPLDSNINNPNTWESQPSITSDGKTLYFVSDRPGGFGGYDIYHSRKTNGHWTRAENLGPVINTKGNEKSPFIHTDSQTLYFSSDGRLGMGGYDIFYSKMKEDGLWQEPKNIGYPINTRFDDVSFFVSTDGHLGYFASNQMKGPGGWDIFSFELYKEARPENVLLLKGRIMDEKKSEPVEAKIELQNIITKSVTEIPVDSFTGEYAFAIPFKNDYLLTVKKQGYAFSSKYISKEDSSFEAPAKADIDIKPIAVGESYRINDIYFKTDSFNLTAGSKVVIDHFIVFLNENPNMKISINGHTDNIGGYAYNLNLSENRAKSVYEYLLIKGITASLLTYKGFGDTKPIDTNSTPEGRARNRRTEFVIIEK